MENSQPHKSHHSDVSWSTLFYTLMAITLIGLAFLLQAWTSNFALTILLSLTVLLFIESIVLSVVHHPRTWRTIGWIILLLLLAGLLAGALVP